MENLPDECLLMIFEYLPIVDKIRIERVCRKWKAVSRRSWNTFKKLDFRSKTWTSRYLQKIEISKKIFDKVMRLTGRCLTSINFYHTNTKYNEGICFELNINILREICQWCTKLEELVFTPVQYIPECELGQSHCTHDEHKFVPWIKPHSTKIKRLGLSLFDFNDSKKDLAGLFAKMSKLTSIHLDISRRTLSRTYLQELPLKNLEEIGFSRASSSSQNISLICSVIKECSDKLHTIRISCIHIDNPDLLIEALLSHINLRNLTIDYLYTFEDPERKILSCVSQLTCLQSLDIKAMNVVDDYFLRVVASNCKMLLKLDISYCFNVSDAGLSSVSSLERLRCLSIKFLRVICPPLGKMQNLEKLYCAFVVDLRCESLCALVRKARNLRVLNVKDCRYVTNELLDVAVEVVKKRDKNLMLNIVAIGTNINVNRLAVKPALLNVITF